MPPPWLTLHYDSVGRQVRRRAHLERTLAETLLFPALHEKRTLGDEGAEALSYVADRVRPDAQQAARIEPTHLEKQIASAIAAGRRSIQGCDAAIRRTVNSRMLAFTKRVRNWRCSSCKVSSSCRKRTACAHSLREATLPTPPPCLDPFVQEIEIAREFVETLYSPFLPAKDRRVHADLVLSSNRRDRACIDGRTTLKDRRSLMKAPRGRLRRSVRVDIMLPQTMDADNSFALIYVAAHELGVHAVERFSDPGGPQGDREYRGFSEGLVDMAISEALLRHLSRREGKFACHQIGTRHRRDQHTKDGTYDDPDTARIQITSGHIAYGGLCELGRAAAIHKLTQLGAEEWAKQVVLALNVAPLLEEQREDVLQSLQAIHDRSSLPDDLDPENRLIVHPDGMVEERWIVRFFDLLEKVREMPSEGAFVTELLEFCPKP